MTYSEDAKPSSEVTQVDTKAEEIEVVTVTPEEPRRNLTKDFALCMERRGLESDTKTTNSVKIELQTTLPGKNDSAGATILSPTSVLPPEPEHEISEKNQHESYRFQIHPKLQRGLSQALVDRVSFYGIVHDINKEASAMAANDPKHPSGPGFDETREESNCALVQAAAGTPCTSGDEASCSQGDLPIPSALIDEEAWLLDVVEQRGSEERSTSTTCPPTFLQAMGEREYENPVQALSGASRTQLWKPSRSWWEAKSGKNPWIEPSSHNKRWRYLWPLIHYHKFLAKCIKKLKRNGVDVKHAVSPVAVFLREEVCAVSDHLAECSRFNSEEWMTCLKHFHGWTQFGVQDDLRDRIRLLKLRPLQEPGDVDSKLLRDQVDAHFLNAMAKARAQLREGNELVEGSGDGSKSRGQPPVYPRSGMRADATPVTRQGSNAYPHAARRQTQVSPAGHHEHYGAHPAAHHTPYWGWEQHSMAPTPYGDTSSVHSALSTDSAYVQPPYPPLYMHPMPPPHGYHHPHYYSGHMVYETSGGYPRSHKQPQSFPVHETWADPSAYGPPMYHQHPYPTPMTHGLPVEISEHEDVSENVDIEIPHAESEVNGKEATPPLKFHTQAQQQQSPFWSHLDSVAVGLATPAKSPGTPRRVVSHDAQEIGSAAGYTVAAQPLLLRGYPHYGHYGARDGYAPPSPATQFMMSPQANFGPAYGYYGISPNGTNRSPRKKLSQHTPPADAMTPPPPVRKLVTAHDASLRESPTTVGTTESESLPEPSA